MTNESPEKADPNLYEELLDYLKRVEQDGFACGIGCDMGACQPEGYGHKHDPDCYFLRLKAWIESAMSTLSAKTKEIAFLKDGIKTVSGQYELLVGSKRAPDNHAGIIEAALLKAKAEEREKTIRECAEVCMGLYAETSYAKCNEAAEKILALSKKDAKENV
jgi:hypothetical protein